VADEKVIQLLEEIRDLQKLHAENYKEALRNQQESIEIQRRAVRRQKIVLLACFFLLVIFLVIFIRILAWRFHSYSGTLSAQYMLRSIPRWRIQ
jgi:uncharacterized membrane protein YvbJ